MSEELKTEDFTQPSPLPIGLTEFHTWADSIIERSGLPQNDSVKKTLARSITQIPQDVAEVPKAYFLNVLRKLAANQVAFQVEKDYYEKQQALKAASDAASYQTEAVAATSSTPVG